MKFGMFMSVIKISLFGNFVGIIFQKRKFCCKIIFKLLMPGIKISFFGIYDRGNFLPKKEILLQNGFQITYVAIRIFLFWNVGPIKFPFWEILMDYVINNFLKRQFCFPGQKKFSSFLTLLHNPSKFPFWEFPKKAILHPQTKEIFTILGLLT